MPSPYDFNQLEHRVHELERRVHELERLVDMLQKLAHSHQVTYPPQYNTWSCTGYEQNNPGG